VPHLAGDALRALIGMDDHDLGMALEARIVGMDVQLAEPSTERLLILDGDVLITEEQHEVVCEGDLQCVERVVADGTEIDSQDLGADGRRERSDDHVPPLIPDRLSSFARRVDRAGSQPSRQLALQ